MESTMYDKEYKQSPRQVFDGFCHRPYNEDTNGWIMEQPHKSEYPVVKMAQDVLSMFQEIKVLREENWRLRKDVDYYKQLSGYK